MRKPAVGVLVTTTRRLDNTIKAHEVGSDELHS